jgi:hypothetical protein
MNIASKDMNKDRLQTLARDLRKTPPRTPRETLGGFVIADRMLEGDARGGAIDPITIGWGLIDELQRD